MKIRCKLERAGGSHVTIGGKEYHFKPQGPGGPHIAEVTDKEHIGRLLSITEGYEVHDEVVVAEQELPLPTPPGVKPASMPEPETAVSMSEQKEDFAAILEGMTEEEIISTYGPGTDFNLKIDKRYAKANMVALVLDRASEEAN